MITEQKIATMDVLFGSASKTSMLRRARPLIVAALSDEAINGSVTFGLILVLQSFDDLVNPGMGSQQGVGQLLRQHLVVLSQPGQGYRQNEDKPRAEQVHTASM